MSSILSLLKAPKVKLSNIHIKQFISPHPRLFILRYRAVGLAVSLPSERS